MEGPATPIRLMPVRFLQKSPARANLRQVPVAALQFRSEKNARAGVHWQVKPGPKKAEARLLFERHGRYATEVPGWLCNPDS